MGVQQFNISTSINDSDYVGFFEDKNGNIYTGNYSVSSGVFEITTDIFQNSLDFANSSRDISGTQPFQFNQYSDFIFTVSNSGSGFGFDNTIPIPMADGNTYNCLIIKFREFATG